MLTETGADRIMNRDFRVKLGRIADVTKLRAKVNINQFTVDECFWPGLMVQPEDANDKLTEILTSNRRAARQAPKATDEPPRFLLPEMTLSSRDFVSPPGDEIRISDRMVNMLEYIKSEEFEMLLGSSIQITNFCVTK